MNDKNNIDQTTPPTPHDEPSDKFSFLDTATLVRRALDDGINYGATSGVKIYEFVKPKVRWMQRVSGWFKAG